jgi:hypothetical protein
MGEGSEDSNPDPAAEAFEGLRAEVAQLRSIIEAMTPAADYLSTLVAMNDSLAEIATHPALRLTPQSLSDEIRHAVDAERTRARLDVDRTLRSLVAATEAVQRVTASRRDRLVQDQWLLAAAVGSSVLGVLLWIGLSGPIARTLPARWHVAQSMAAATMNLPLWDAGAGLMRSADPVRWAALQDSLKPEAGDRRKPKRLLWSPKAKRF